MIGGNLRVKLLLYVRLLVLVDAHKQNKCENSEDRLHLSRRAIHQEEKIQKSLNTGMIRC